MCGAVLHRFAVQEYARKLGLEKQLVIVRGDKKKTKVTATAHNASHPPAASVS